MTAHKRHAKQAGKNPVAAAGCVATAGMMAVMSLAACSGQNGQNAAAKATESPTASASRAPTCQSQFTTWRDGGGVADLTAVSHALARFSRVAIAAAVAGLSDADLARVGKASAALQAAAQTALANPPPACVPGLRAHEGTATADLSQAAQGALDGVQAAQHGDMQTATSDVQAAANNIVAGSNAIKAATQDIQAFTASG
jgi:hypothetical protein